MRLVTTRTPALKAQQPESQLDYANMVAGRRQFNHFIVNQLLMIPERQ